MVVGGTDTSSHTIELAMAEIMNKPEVMRKTQQELGVVVGKDNIVEESHIHKLPYLYAVMKETLRLHPALPLLVPHCPSETCTVGGYTIPKGSRIFVNVWAIQRDPSIWVWSENMCWNSNGWEDGDVFPCYTFAFLWLEIAPGREIGPYRKVWDCTKKEDPSCCNTYPEVNWSIYVWVS